MEPDPPTDTATDEPAREARLSYDPPPIGPRRLTRTSEDRMIAGVCGGIATYLGVDPTLVRIGFALLSLTGIGLVAYALAWVLLPEEGDTSPRWRPPWQLAAIAVGVWILANWIDIWEAEAITFPLALLVIGAVLVWGARDGEVTTGRSERRSTPGAPAPPLAGAGAPTAVVQQTGPGRWSWAPSPDAGPGVVTGTDPTTRYSAILTAPPAVSGGRRSTGRTMAVGIGGILIAIAAVTGALALSDDIDPAVTLGLALAGFGVAMVLGSWWGWARPLAFGGMAVVLALAVVLVVDVPLTGGIGDPVVRPATLADLPATERLAVGKLTVDLSDLTFTGDERRLEATVAAGELVVIVPEGVTVELDGEVGVGEIEAFEADDDGWSVEVDRVFESTGPGRIELDLRVGVGHLEVRRG